jgi:HK97 family phage portal protein
VDSFSDTTLERSPSVAFWNRRKAESRSLPPAENQLPLLAAYTGSPVNTSNALAIADVWAAVRVLADAASSLPLHVYRRTDDGRERVTSGALVDLLERPGPGTTQADLVSTLMAHVAIWGNSFIAKFREAGEIVQLGLLAPDRVRPELHGGQLRFRYQPGTGPDQMLSTSDVIHVKGLSTDGLVGLSAVTQAARVLGLSDELVKHAVAYFQTGTITPAGVLKLAPEPNAPDEVGRNRLQERLRNEARPHGVLVIEGESDYTPIGQRLDDSQFVEQRRLAAQEIARVFRIPAHFLNAGTGGDSLTYSTAESMSIDFVKYSLTPWLRRIELGISNDRDLTFERTFVKFELDGLLRADADTRSQVYTRALDPVTGYMTRDEVRRLEDLSPEPARPQTVEQLVANPQQPPQPQEVAGNGRG